VTDPVPPPPSGRWFGPRRLLGVGTGIMLGSVMALVLGFAWFVFEIQNYASQPSTGSADGIVVLTGGAERVMDATNLLLAKRGRRLLITGVHPDTTLAEISRTVPAATEQLECCVELGHSALNTRGNALEAAEWTRRLGFRSLIVVTSAWHMPRALVELEHAMPEIELMPYAVVTDRMRREPWWSGFGTGRVLFIEYVKYLAAKAGIRPWPAMSSDVQARG
jgi:uncharacterized SAM-binding protein YcdF (DUF218 family)